jgi:formate dehydrogenase (coenzyme F420) beta subunit
MLDALRQHCRRLLEHGEAAVVIGYGQDRPGREPHPVFITRPDDAGRLVWNDRCLVNLTAYLKRKEIRALGKPAIVVKACDERALVVLQKESQIERAGIVVIGMACPGMDAPRCRSCTCRVPRWADVTIGEPPQSEAPARTRYAELEAFMQRTPAERMAFWRAEFARCTKCYACRQACPLCYCERCVVDKNRPTVIDTSATLKGNFAWHITRAFHLAGRCVGCDQCVRACPAGIDLHLLNLSLAKAAEEEFGFRPGDDPQQEPIVGAYSPADREDFIR